MNCDSYEYPEEDGVYKCADCMNGYGLEENGTECFKCDDPNCIMCDQGPEFCEFCSNYTFWKNGKCVSSCVDPNCDKCNPYNNADCLYCKDGYGLYKVKVEVEPEEGVEQEEYYDHYCKPCAVSNCEMCDIGFETCGRCKPGYRVANNFTECQKCTDPNCHNCPDYADVCDFCFLGYHLTQSGKCVKCKPENCEDCSDSTSVCFECLDGYTFDLREGSSTFGKCSKCNVYNCAQCDFALSFCVECLDGYSLVGGHCLNADGIDEGKIRNRGKDGKSKVGIIVGVIVGVVAVAAIVTVVVIVVKRKQGGGDAESSQESNLQQ